MPNSSRQVLVSRPTFAELSDAIAKAGLLNLMSDDGNIEIGDVVIHTEDGVLQNARLAAAIDQAASKVPCCSGDATYEDDRVALYTKCKPDGVHLIERRPGQDANVVTVPRAAITQVAGDLIECLGREPN